MPTAASLRNFHDLVEQCARRHGDREFLPRRTPQDRRSTSFAELANEVRTFAAGLLERGVTRGTTIGLISENRAEWLACDLACASIGAVDVPRGTDTGAGELTFILTHAGCRLAIVEHPRVAHTLLERHAELPELHTVIVIDGLDAGLPAAPPGVTVLSYAEVRAAGAAHLAAQPDCLDAAAAQVGRDDLLTIIYTSGTTANPKGVELTHGNLLENLDMVEEVLHFAPEDTALSLLPAWHAYERIMDYVLVFAGSRLIYSDKRNIRDDLAEVRPTILVAVPRIWEMIHDGIVGAVRKLSGSKRRLLDYVLASARRRGSGRATLGDHLAWLALRPTLVPKLLAASTGGRVRVAVSGGGALPAHVDQRLLGFGLPLLNGYGLTETAPVLAVRTPDDNRWGTIGRPLPRTEIEIRDAADRPLPPGSVGLIWARGPQVMRGYHDNPEATAAVLRDDGWFNTGDLGAIDPDGQIRITGRAKDTIVLAGGENVEPERVETLLKTSPLIEQVVVVGQDRKSLGALIVPHVEHLEHDLPRDAWSEQGGVLQSTEVKRLFRAEIDRLLREHGEVRNVERIGGFAVVAQPMTPDNGLLTQTLKVRRHVVHERFADLIERLYGA